MVSAGCRGLSYLFLHQFKNIGAGQGGGTAARHRDIKGQCQLLAIFAKGDLSSCCRLGTGELDLVKVSARKGPIAILVEEGIGRGGISPVGGG